MINISVFLSFFMFLLTALHADAGSSINVPEVRGKINAPRSMDLSNLLISVYSDCSVRSLTGDWVGCTGNYADSIQEIPVAKDGSFVIPKISKSSRLGKFYKLNVRVLDRRQYDRTEVYNNTSFAPLLQIHYSTKPTNEHPAKNVSEYPANWKNLTLLSLPNNVFSYHTTSGRDLHEWMKSSAVDYTHIYVTTRYFSGDKELGAIGQDLSWSRDFKKFNFKYFNEIRRLAPVRSFNADERPFDRIEVNTGIVVPEMIPLDSVLVVQDADIETASDTISQPAKTIYSQKCPLENASPCESVVLDDSL
jgi:hypothetical protein